MFKIHLTQHASMHNKTGFFLNKNILFLQKHAVLNSNNKR